MASEAKPLVIRLFGPFQAQWRGQPLHKLAQHRNQSALLALLCLYPDRVLAKEWVIEQLWPGEGRSTGNLNKLVNDTLGSLQTGEADPGRHAGDPPLSLSVNADTMISAGGTLRLDTRETFIDTVAFDRAWERRETVPAELSEAIELYLGPLLQDWEHWDHREWVIEARKRYARRYRDALGWLASHALAKNDLEAAMRYVRSLQLVGDFAERLHGQLMASLMSAEQYGVASQFFEEFRADLKQNRDLAPPRDMVAHYERIPRTSRHFVASYDPELVEEEPIGGGMELGSPYYITRRSDEIVHAAVKRKDCIVRIEGPRQTGKTSLLARALEQSRQNGAMALISDFQSLGPADTASIDRFFLALAYQFHRQIEGSLAPADTWDPALSANLNFDGYMREIVLEATQVPIVWAIDEADRIFDRDYYSSVFGLFRSWHNKRSLSSDTAWRRFTLILAYSAEARMLIANPNESPFNVGTGVILEDFARDQVEELNRRYETPLADAGALERLIELVGGHPYLVRRCLYEMKTGGARIDEIMAESELDNGLFTDHLSRLRTTVAQTPERLYVVREILQGRPCTDLDTFSRLRSAGVLAGNAMNEARLRCRLYETHLKAIVL